MDEEPFFLTKKPLAVSVAWTTTHIPDSHGDARWDEIPEECVSRALTQRTGRHRTNTTARVVGRKIERKQQQKYQKCKKGENFSTLCLGCDFSAIVGGEVDAKKNVENGRCSVMTHGNGVIRRYFGPDAYACWMQEK